MSLSSDPSKTSAFYHFGDHTIMDSEGSYNFPEEISIGNHVVINHSYWINIIAKGVGKSPKIVIGDGCQCDEGLIISAMNHIELEKNVKLGRRVFISDTDHVYQDIGKPILTQGLTETTGRVWIGEGTIIEHGVVISGNISIGPGSLIRANSLVEHNIPAHSIVEGIPAQIVGISADK